jgi:hypothetical protein
MVVRGEPVYSCVLNVNSEVEIWSLKFGARRPSRLVTGGFSEGNASHYRPPWSRPRKSGVDSCSLKLCFSSENNLKFNVKPKTTNAQRNLMEEEEEVFLMQ